LHVAPEVADRRPHPGRGEGMSATSTRRGAMLAAPHHDGSDLYIAERPDELGGTAVLRVRVPDGAADQVLLRFVRDGERETVVAVVDEVGDGETWWRAELPVENPVVGYRWLLTGGSSGYAWLNGRGVVRTEVTSGDDFRFALDAGAPAWHQRSVVYEIF